MIRYQKKCLIYLSNPILRIPALTLKKNVGPLMGWILSASKLSFKGPPNSLLLQWAVEAPNVIFAGSSYIQATANPNRQICK